MLLVVVSELEGSVCGFGKSEFNNGFRCSGRSGIYLGWGLETKRKPT